MLEGGDSKCIDELMEAVDSYIPSQNVIQTKHS